MALGLPEPRVHHPCGGHDRHRRSRDPRARRPAVFAPLHNALEPLAPAATGRSQCPSLRVQVPRHLHRLCRGSGPRGGGRRSTSLLGKVGNMYKDVGVDDIFDDMEDAARREGVWRITKRMKTTTSDPMHVDNFPDITKAALRKRGIETLFPIQAQCSSPRCRAGTWWGGEDRHGEDPRFSLPIIESLLSTPATAPTGPRNLHRARAHAQLWSGGRRFGPGAATSASSGCAISSQGVAGRGVSGAWHPGQLIDLIQRGSLDHATSNTVLDEADQMLAVGFEEASSASWRRSRSRGRRFSSRPPCPFG